MTPEAYVLFYMRRGFKLNGPEDLEIKVPASTKASEKHEGEKDQAQEVAELQAQLKAAREEYEALEALKFEQPGAKEMMARFFQRQEYKKKTCTMRKLAQAVLRQAGYSRVRPIKEGGFGMVFQATTSEGTVAIKMAFQEQ